MLASNLQVCIRQVKHGPRGIGRVTEGHDGQYKQLFRNGKSTLVEELAAKCHILGASRQLVQIIQICFSEGSVEILLPGVDVRDQVDGLMTQHSAQRYVRQSRPKLGDEITKMRVEWMFWVGEDAISGKESHFIRVHRMTGGVEVLPTGGVSGISHVLITSCWVGDHSRERHRFEKPFEPWLTIRDLHPANTWTTGKRYLIGPDLLEGPRPV